MTRADATGPTENDVPSVGPGRREYLGLTAAITTAALAALIAEHYLPNPYAIQVLIFAIVTITAAPIAAKPPTKDTRP